MVKNHLKRIAAPKSWLIANRKERKFITRPNSGAHSFELGVPLNMVLKYWLMHANNEKEVKNILTNCHVMVDGVVKKNPKFLVGLMDLIEIKKTNELYRVLISKKKKIFLLPIGDSEKNLKLCKVIGKTKIKGNKTQLNLGDGRNILSENNDCKRGDSLLIEVPSQKIKDNFKLKKKRMAYLKRGRHIGELGLIKDILGKRVFLKSKDKEVFETHLNYVFVVGNENAAIRLEL